MDVEKFPPALHRAKPRVRWKRVARITGVLMVVFAVGLLAVWRGGDEIVPPRPVEPPPSLEELVGMANRSLEKLKNAPARWTVSLGASARPSLSVDVVQDKDRVAWSFYQRVNNDPVLLGRVVHTDGVWHVIEENRHAVYRPFEAELHVPGGFALIALSEPKFIEDTRIMEFARYRGRIAQKLLYALPLDPKERATMESAVSQLERQIKNDLRVAKPEEVSDSLSRMRGLLRNGDNLEVDASTGLITRYDFGKAAVMVNTFQWLEKVPEDAFALPAGVEWEDHTKPWSAAELADCVMVQHDPNFKGTPGTPNLDGYLLNLRTSELRRLPYHGAACMPACFLGDRRWVVVSTGLPGAMELVKLNLLTGENNHLEFDPPAPARFYGSELAPNGTDELALEVSAGKELMDFQLHVVNHETKRRWPLGEVGRWGAPMSWLPDGSGIVLKRYEPVANLSDIEPRIVCRMDLDGKSTDLHRGDTPLVLRKEKKILYQAEGTRLWHTCALDGSNVELYAGGMANHRAPAVSPDEKKILFVRYAEGKLPQLLLFEIGKTEGEPAVKTKGFLSDPVWR